MATPTKKSAARKGAAKRVSHSKKAGLLFPVGRIGSQLRKGRYAARVSSSVAVYCAAVLEYVVAEVLELAAKAVLQRNKSKRITPRALTLAVLWYVLQKTALGKALRACAENPAAALRSAHKILKPAGQLLILDLLKHNFEKASELYGDRWAGFAESDLQRWLEEAGFKKIEINVVATEEQPPHFQTVLAGGEK